MTPAPGSFLEVKPKTQEDYPMEYAPKKRRLTDSQCQASAKIIAAEMQEETRGWWHIWTPADFDVKAARLYHPAEATAIRAVLMEMGALSA
jgi:hypothetical protein